MYNMIKETLEMEKQGMKKRNKKIRKRGKTGKRELWIAFTWRMLYNHLGI